MKKKEIVNLLNQDLSGEIEAILIYMRNSFVTGECKPSRTMEEIARDEMRHADKLAEMIVDLGDIPSMVYRELDFGRKGTKGALARIITLEKGAIAMYKKHIESIPDEEIRKTLTHILREEEVHLEDATKLFKG